MEKVINMDDAKSRTERAKALGAALAQIEKQFGKGAIMKFSDSEVERDIQVVSTGSLGLDIALGVGGLPRGRVVEIYGPESSGKTTLALHAIAEARYYFGGPVSGAVVRWRVFASPYVFDRWQGPAGEGSYSFTDYDEADTEAIYAPGGIVVTEGEGEMDAEGQFEFLLPADIKERSTSQVSWPLTGIASRSATLPLVSGCPA